MRHSLPTAALLSILLSACASAPTPAKSVDQSGALKVHPGLLGQPVPPELQPLDSPVAAPAASAAPAATENNGAKAGGVKMEPTGLPTQRNVYFDRNSADIKAEDNALLQAHAGYLAKHPTARVRIEGNADERGPADYNRKLGQSRADAVRQSLLNQGADTKQVKAVSMGESKPKLKGHDEESWAENRRADIVYERE